MSKGTVNLLLKNLLKEAVTDSAGTMTEEAMELCGLSSIKKQTEQYKNIPHTVVTENENIGELLIKIEPKIENLEFENISVDYSISTYDGNKQEIKLSPQNLEEMEYTLEIPDHSYSVYGISSDKPSTLFSQDNGAFLKIGDGTIMENEWKIKEEQINIKDEDIEQSDASTCTSCFGSENQECQSTHQCSDQANTKNKVNGNKKSLKDDHEHSDIVDRSKYDQQFDQTIHKRNLRANMIQHKNPDEVGKLKCKQCNFQTIYKSNLRKHMLRHQKSDQTEIFKCDQCHFLTIHKASLHNHMLRHQNYDEIATFKCNKCKYQAAHRKYLDAHMIQHKKPDEVEIFNCDQCSFQTIRKTSLHSHMLRHKNPDEVDMLKCDKCDFQTTRKIYLRRHTLRHK